MKILLDENLDVDIRHSVVGHDVHTVAYMRWKGLRNGQLIAAATGEGFDVLVTTDQGMADQINLHGRPIAIVILHASSNAIDDVLPLIPRLLTKLANIAPGSFVHVRS